MSEFPSPVRITRLQVVMASLFIFIATMMTFVNAVNADFVSWDDDVYVTHNPYVQKLTTGNLATIFSRSYYSSWNPITLFSHAIDVALWGLDPKGHHLTNVLLHSLNAVFFFAVSLVVQGVAREDRERGQSLLSHVTPSVFVGSLVAAILYAMHPLRVESVAWVSGRRDLLCVFFLLPAFGSYLLWNLRHRKFLLIATHVFFALALLTTPMAATFPIILVLVDIWWMKKHSEKANLFDRLVEGKVLLLLLSVAAVGVRLFVMGGEKFSVVGDLSRVDRFLLPPYMIFFYLWKTIVPLDLSPIYPDLNGAMLVIAPLAFVAIAYGCFAMIGKKRYGVALAFFSYVIVLCPTILGLSLGVQPMADRYSYLSTISMFMLVGGCVEWLWRRSSTSLGGFNQRKLLFTVLLILCGVYAYRTIRHVAIWNNSVSLWSQAVRYAPATREEFESRRPYIKPNYLDAYTKLGTLYFAVNEQEKGVEQFRKAVMLDSRNAGVHLTLATLMFEKGDNEGSKSSLQKALSCDSLNARALSNLGFIYALQDSTELAVDAFRKAARLGLPDAQQVLKEKGYTW